MIYFAVSLGVFSYCIFFLGILGMLYPIILNIFSVMFMVVSVVVFKKQIYKFVTNTWSEIKKIKIAIILTVLVFIQVLVNSIGIFGPEIGFDALWYHLTLPKLYLLYNKIFYISGGLLYYSVMPKMGEMLFVAGLSFGSDIIPKAIQFLCGIASVIILYSFLRKYISVIVTLIGVLLFYSSLVVGWESTSAYIDLIRTMYELLALTIFIKWIDSKNFRWLSLSAVLLGFAISIKLLAIGSVGIFVVLLIIHGWSNHEIKATIGRIAVFVSIALVIPLPWFIFSFSTTGSPIYPFFSAIYPVTAQIALFHPIIVLKEVLTLLLFSADPISPLFLVFFPVVITQFKRMPKNIRMIAIYCLLSLVVWIVTPRTGGGRFILPYLPGWSIVTAVGISYVLRIKKQRMLVFITVFIFVLVSILYRGFANSKYFPYIFHQQSKAQFLASHLNFSFGDFYDIDGFFTKHIRDTDKVLLYGFHNLYYVDFPYIDSSWVKIGDVFTHIATQNAKLPIRFMSWEKIYTNSITNVSLYANGKKSEIF